MKTWISALSLTAALTGAAAAATLSVSPDEFDFGWAPDNAKISCSFTVRNQGSGLLNLTAVKPACGCTASEFTPSSIESNQETQVWLTFNTRGYTGRDFDKPTDIEAGGGVQTVRLKGHVTNPGAKLAPEGDGMAGFDGKNGRKKTVKLKNLSNEELNLAIVQAPHAWAEASLSATSVPAGGTVDLPISVSGGLDADRFTSVTVEGRGKETTARATIAIWTGSGPRPLRRAPGAKAPATAPKPADGAPKPAPAPAPQKKK